MYPKINTTFFLISVWVLVKYFENLKVKLDSLLIEVEHL